MSVHQNETHVLLVWVTFTGHTTEEVVEEFRKKNISMGMIPGGCTSKVQPLNMLNKSFKSSCRSKWVVWLQESVSQQQPSVKIKIASKQQVLNWVVQANKDLNSNKDLVCKSFKVCGISNAIDGTENHFIHCAKELDQLKVAYRLENEEEEDADESAEDPFASGSEIDSSDSEIDMQ